MTNENTNIINVPANRKYGSTSISHNVTDNHQNVNSKWCFLTKLLRSERMEYATAIVFATLLWILMYILFGQEVTPPDGGLFSLIILLVCSLIFGRIAQILRLPALLGMLLCGIILANTGLYKVYGVYANIVSRLREAALCVILVKGSLGLEPDVLFKKSVTVIKLASIPCVGEALVSAVASRLVLNLPWIWGLSLGFILSAVSPAVVVTSLLKLKEQGYGEDKGISTLIIAASNIDDIFCISLFGILMAILFVGGDFTSSIIRGPLEMAIGISSGAVLGFIMAFIPSPNEKHASTKRALIMAVCSLAFVLGTPLLDLPGAGPLGTIVSSFIANAYWIKTDYKTGRNPVASAFSGAWVIMQPMLFGLIGTEINLQSLTVELVVKGIVVISFGLVARMVFCCLAILGSGLNMKEMLFVNAAWLPKATVQAALGPVLLDMLHEKNITDVQMVEYATSVLSIAVLSILITAPIGAIGISVLGPRLLNKKLVKIFNPEINEAYQNEQNDVTGNNRL